MSEEWNKIALKALKQSISEVCDEETEKEIKERQQILQKIYEKNITFPKISFGKNSEIIIDRHVKQEDIKDLGFKRHKDKGYWYRPYSHYVIERLESILNIDLTGF